MRYTPYGETRSGSVPTDRRFTGQRHEAGLGLYDYRARTYDPDLARFVQPDTIVPEAEQPQDLNRYSYVRGNPLRYTDPSGHCIFGLDTVVCIAAAGAAAGTAIGYGKQVLDNTRSGMSLGDALTTDIDPAPIVAGGFLGGAAGAFGAFVATAAGIGAGAGTIAGTAITAAGADGDYTNELQAAGRVVTELADDVAASSSPLAAPPGGTGAAYSRFTGQGVYVLRDAHGVVRYVGRGDVHRRLASHAADPLRSGLQATVLADNNLSYDQARGLEQLLMDHFGGPRGDQLLNRINGMSPTNGNGSRYLQAGQSLLREALAMLGE